jgi:hypothetical protein
VPNAAAPGWTRRHVLTEGTDAFEGAGFALVVHGDRIEVEGKKRQQSIPFTEISSVTVAFRPKRLVVMTRAGKRHEFVLRQDTETARAVIASRLAAV